MRKQSTFLGLTSYILLAAICGGHAQAQTPIRHWTFDDGIGDVAIDTMGNHNASLIGFEYNATSGWTNEGKYGGALRFSNSNNNDDPRNLVNLGFNPVGDTTFTYAMWINISDFSSPYTSVASQYICCQTGRWAVGVGDSGNLHVFDGVMGHKYSGSILNTDEWYYVAYVRNGVNWKAYYSNGDDMTLAINVNGDSANPLADDNFIGRNHFNGTVDDYRIWDVALGYTQLQDLYDAYFPPPLLGDLDGDGFVGINDLNIILANWNQFVPPGDPRADAGGVGGTGSDGFIGIDDLNVVLANWNAGTPPPVEASSVVPEPGTAAMLMLGGLILFNRAVVSV